MMRGEDIMGWVLVICVLLGVIQGMMFFGKKITEDPLPIVCAQGELYTKQKGETFWRGLGVKCMPEDKE